MSLRPEVVSELSPHPAYPTTNATATMTPPVPRMATKATGTRADEHESGRVERQQLSARRTH